jgi:hypothetical protein
LGSGSATFDPEHNFALWQSSFTDPMLSAGGIGNIRFRLTVSFNLRFLK